jgi:multicomponent Na+:H+ antiporter subunit D
VFTSPWPASASSGLPPSGGFVAKWLLLQAAWAQDGWVWIAVILVGGLLAAAYLFRPLAALTARPAPSRQAGADVPAPRVPASAALALAFAALAAGFVPAPMLAFLAGGLPPGWPMTDRAAVLAAAGHGHGLGAGRCRHLRAGERRQSACAPP